jgi:hypothetical protein
VPDREPYEYDQVPATEILRPLDPTEHNMERLNRIGQGAGVVYQTARVRGPLDRAVVEAALSALTRHPALRMRVVRGPEGVLGFAAVPDCHLELRWIQVDDVARAWPLHVEADMNAGPVASHRGSAFRAFVFTSGGEHAITLVAPHHVWDGLSAVALMRELLEQIARPRALPPVALRAVDSPFVAPCSARQRARLGDLTLEVAAWADSPPSARHDRRGPLCAALEQLEADLLAGGDGHALPAALLDVQRLLAQVERWHPDGQYIVANEDPGPPPERAGRVRTGLLVDVIGADVVKPLAAAARQRGVTMHGVFGGAALFGHVARHWGLTGPPDGPRLFPIASPVNLRKQFNPPLADGDVRMAVDVALTVIPVEPADRFWDVAARFSAAVTREVRLRRSLGSWFRTEPRSSELPLPGVPIPLVSNVGRVAAPISYGDLQLLDLHACMSTHNMFQIVMVVQTLGDTADICHYHELPTVSRQSMRGLADTVRAVLKSVAAGQAPMAGDAVSARRW